MLETAIAAGTRALPDGMALRPWTTRRHTLGRTTWNVHLRERSPQGVGVLTSVARALRGGPCAHQRLVACAQGVGTGRSRRHGEDVGGTGIRPGRRRGSLAALIRRSLMPVPPPGPRVVRGSGLYAPTKGAALARCRAQLGQEPVAMPAVLAWQTAGGQRGAEPPASGPVGAQRLVCRGMILRPCMAPSVRAPTAVAA